MMTPRLLPAKEARAEITIVNSRFIASLAPAFSTEEARAYIHRIKDEFADASHNVPAFIIGHGASITEHCQDDGEPQGTAGRPMLSVLRGSGLGDVVLVVTRYFGGTKLGKGGLVRAYGDAARAVLNQSSLAEKIATTTVMVAIDYAQFEQTRELIKTHAGLLQPPDFGTDILLTIKFRDSELARFNQALTNLTHGSAQTEIIEADPNTIFPRP
jgi:uncharacterized YigZ family protein